MHTSNVAIEALSIRLGRNVKCSHLNLPNKPLNTKDTSIVGSVPFLSFAFSHTFVIWQSGCKKLFKPRPHSTRRTCYISKKPPFVLSPFLDSKIYSYNFEMWWCARSTNSPNDVELGSSNNISRPSTSPRSRRMLNTNNYLRTIYQQFPSLHHLISSSKRIAQLTIILVRSTWNPLISFYPQETRLFNIPLPFTVATACTLRCANGGKCTFRGNEQYCK